MAKATQVKQRHESVCAALLAADALLIVEVSTHPLVSRFGLPTASEDRLDPSDSTRTKAESAMREQTRSNFRTVTLLAMTATLVLAGCGATTYSRKTIVWEPFNAAESRQQKDNVTVELKLADELPPSFMATVARCDQLGRFVVDEKGNPRPETISLGTNDQVWQQVAITNGTENVLRLNGVVIRLFDPAAQQFNVLTMADLRAELLSKRPCPSTQTALNIFAANPIFDRNIEVVPGTTSTFWVAFRPASKLMPGIWKMALYDVPVSLDPAGRPIRTTRFETRISVKEVTRTYSRESLMATPKLIESTEQSATGTKTTTPGAPMAPAAAPPAVTAPVAPSAAATSPPATRALDPTSPSAIGLTQARLNALGFDAGPADGIPGARTRQALMQFQRSKGLPASGRLDTPTLAALGL